MGLSPSKRVTHTLSTSLTFVTTCDDVYKQTVTLSEHTFNGVPPYQLATSATLLHHYLSSSLPLVSRWLPHPPYSSQIHHAYRDTIAHLDTTHRAEEACLDREEFREFALRLFTGAVMESVGKEVAKTVPVGVLGIFGVGAVARAGKDLVGAAAGVYALGVAASVYLSLAG